MAIRTLLLGRGLFLHGLKRLLDAEPNVSVVAAAESWTELRDRIGRGGRPQVLIVDHAAGALGADLTALLEAEPGISKVIRLAHEENRMVVHDLKRVADAQLADLMRALGNPSTEATNTVKNDSVKNNTDEEVGI